MKKRATLKMMEEASSDWRTEDALLSSSAALEELQRMILHAAIHGYISADSRIKACGLITQFANALNKLPEGKPR